MKTPTTSCDVEPLVTRAEAFRAEGASVMHLAVDGRLVGLLPVSDPVKTSTREALELLTKAGVRIVMATGDGHTTAHAVAKRLGIDEVLYPLTGWLLSPMLAAFAMSLSSVSVTANALRLRRVVRNRGLAAPKAPSSK